MIINSDNSGIRQTETESQQWCSKWALVQWLDMTQFFSLTVQSVSSPSNSIQHTWTLKTTQLFFVLLWNRARGGQTAEEPVAWLYSLPAEALELHHRDRLGEARCEDMMQPRFLLSNYTEWTAVSSSFILHIWYVTKRHHYKLSAGILIHLGKSKEIFSFQKIQLITLWPNT